jgi:hypothetical protein
MEHGTVKDYETVAAAACAPVVMDACVQDRYEEAFQLIDAFGRLLGNAGVFAMMVAAVDLVSRGVPRDLPVRLIPVDMNGNVIDASELPDYARLAGQFISAVVADDDATAHALFLAPINARDVDAIARFILSLFRIAANRYQAIREGNSLDGDMDGADITNVTMVFQEVDRNGQGEVIREW